MTAFRYTNGWRGATAETDEEEVERREAAKKLRRRPLSETIQQLGEGRGKHTDIVSDRHTTDMCRNICAWPRREEATAVDGQVRHRCQGRAGDKLDAPIRHFLVVQQPMVHLESSIEDLRPVQTRVCIYHPKCVAHCFQLCPIFCGYVAVSSRIACAGENTSIKISYQYNTCIECSGTLFACALRKCKLTRERAIPDGTKNCGVASTNTTFTHIAEVHRCNA
jgi:hypothetical protein